MAIIMDGNGRWAVRRGQARPSGHRAGASAVRRTVEAAPELGITIMTLYAFSSDNWKRPHLEVGALMDLLEQYLSREVDECVRNGVRLSVIGRRDRLRPGIVAAIERAEDRTRSGSRLLLRLAIDYSSRTALVQAARQVGAEADSNAFRAEVLRNIHSDPDIPDVDLLIRTGGERRLSDFLLWESAYAELFFTPCLWPDFDRAQLESAVASFRDRQRRFGGLGGAGSSDTTPLVLSVPADAASGSQRP